MARDASGMPSRGASEKVTLRSFIKFNPATENPPQLRLCETYIPVILFIRTVRLNVIKGRPCALLLVWQIERNCRSQKPTTKAPVDSLSRARIDD
jgi:hypothetical protein